MRSSATRCSVVPGFTCIGRETVHLGEAIVGDDDTLLAVEHRQALEHVLQRRIEDEGSATSTSASRSLRSALASSSSRNERSTTLSGSTANAQ